MSKTEGGLPNEDDWSLVYRPALLGLGARPWRTVGD